MGGEEGGAGRRPEERFPRGDAVDAGLVVFRLSDAERERVELRASLAEARARAHCPVIGIGQAGYHVAALLGARFAVLTTLPVSVPVIASGGVGNLDHLVDGVIEGGASAVLAASIFHFGEYTVQEAKQHMAAAGIPMRLS